MSSVTGAECFLKYTKIRVAFSSRQAKGCIHKFGHNMPSLCHRMNGGSDTQQDSQGNNTICGQWAVHICIQWMQLSTLSLFLHKQPSYVVHNTSLPNLPLFNIHCLFPCRYRLVTLDFQCYHRTVYCDILWQQPLYRQYRANGGTPAPLSLICLPSGCPRTDFEFKLSGVCLFVHTCVCVAYICSGGVPWNRWLFTFLFEL